MRLRKPFLGLTRRDKQRNVDIKNKLNQKSIVDEIRSYQQNWFQHVNRMEINRLSKVGLQYQPHGKRDIGRPRKKRSETGSFESECVTQITTYGPKATTFIMMITMTMMMKWDGGMDWIDLARDRDRWLAVVNAVMNLLFP
jgi:hypothetical protein